MVELVGSDTIEANVANASDRSSRFDNLPFGARIMKTKLLGFAITVLAGLSVAACDAGPFTTGAQDPDTTYDVNVVDTVLPFANQNKDLRLHISFPNSGGPFPLILFSHGNGCTSAGYGPVTEYWAARGYVVIEPTHLDSRSLGPTDFSKMAEISDSRVEDLSFILDSLDRIAVLIPGLAGKMNADRVASAGHSMGSATALSASGLRAKNADGSLRTGDDRFDVAVLLSGPGPMPSIPDDAWGDYRTPSIVTTGTNDYTQTNRNKPEGWKWRLGSYNLTPDGDKYALVVQDYDHFLGGYICNRPGVEGPPDTEALTLVRTATSAFLDAYLKDDLSALAFLSSGEMNRQNERADLRAK